MWGSFKIKFFLLLIAIPITLLVSLGKQRLAGNDIPRRVASIRATLPQMLGDSLELQGISYENRSIHYDVMAKSFFDKSVFEEGAFHDAVMNQYCKGKDKFAEAAVSIDYDIRIPPRTLNDRTTHAHVAMHPADCGLAAS